MHSVSLQHLTDIHSQDALASSIQKDSKNTLVCVCHTSHSTLTDTIHRYCNDTFLSYEINEQDPIATFTEILEHINVHLAQLYHSHKKSEVSLFVGLMSENHIHFSMFGRHLTGILVSEKVTEDLFHGMDSHDGQFVYDSHGEIHANECVYIFAPKIDINVVQNECKTVGHLSLAKRCALIAEHIERVNVYKEGVILAIGREDTEERTAWKPTKITPLSQSIVSAIGSKTKNVNTKMQGIFQSMSNKAQNWMLISGLFVSIMLLYIILSGLMKSQYAIFVPQKYRDILAEARVELTNSSRTMEQPEQFGPAITKAKDLIEQVKNKNVLQIEVAEIEKEVAALEKNINKVISLTTKQYLPIYTFGQDISGVPFGMYVFDKKLYFVSQKSIIGPYISGETPKEYPIPNGESMTASDIDSDGRIYMTSSAGKVYLFDKGSITSLVVQQVGGWDENSDISIYNGNIYLLSADKKQIYKHRKQSENMYAGKSLVIAPDTQTHTIINTDIDGSVWLLSGKDGGLITEKILTAPKYERRGIIMNGLGINTFMNQNPLVTKIYTDPSYQEIYILADNRIWIFIPNSKRFNDVRSLSYIGQIDVQNITISDIAVQQSGDMREVFFGSQKSGIFSTRFTVKDNKIHIYSN